MKRPIRAIVYGFAIWWIWFGIAMLGALLPDDVTSAPSFASARLLVLVLLVVTATVDYLRRVERSSVGEGLIVGLTWGLLLVANDFGHFIYMEIVRGLPFDAGLYLGTAAPLYLFVPVITAMVMGGLVAPFATAGLQTGAPAIAGGGPKGFEEPAAGNGSAHLIGSEPFDRGRERIA